MADAKQKTDAQVFIECLKFMWASFVTVAAIFAIFGRSDPPVQNRNVDQGYERNGDSEPLVNFNGGEGFVESVEPGEGDKRRCDSLGSPGSLKPNQPTSPDGDDHTADWNTGAVKAGGAAVGHEGQTTRDGHA